MLLPRVYRMGAFLNSCTASTHTHTHWCSSAHRLCLSESFLAEGVASKVSHRRHPPDLSLSHSFWWSRQPASLSAPTHTQTHTLSLGKRPPPHPPCSSFLLTPCSASHLCLDACILRSWSKQSQSSKCFVFVTAEHNARTTNGSLSLCSCCVPAHFVSSLPNLLSNTSTVLLLWL